MQADFDTIARVHGRTLYARALRLTGESGRAWDLVQDTYEQGLRSSPSQVPTQQLFAWLLVIMKNRFIDECRKTKRRRIRERQLEWSSQPTDEQDNDEEPVWHSISDQQVSQCLTQIDPSFRKVYELRAVENRSYREIANHLGLPMRTVGSRLFRARRMLRQALLENVAAPQITARRPKVAARASSPASAVQVELAAAA